MISEKYLLLKRDITIALFEEKYPDWDPYLAAQAVQKWYQGNEAVFEQWLKTPAVEILQGAEFSARHRMWDQNLNGPLSFSFSSIRRCLGLEYMKTRIHLWQFVDGCFQSGFIPVKAPWES